MTRPYLSAEERRQQAIDALRDGITIGELRDAMGYASTENATRIMEMLCYAGQAFGVRAKSAANTGTKAWTTIYFTTAQARDEFVIAKDAAIAARRKARKAATFRKMPYYAKRDEQRKADSARKAAEKAQRQAMRLAEAELRKQRARLDREAAAAEKQRAKAEAKKTKERLKAETKAAGALKFKKGTDVARPKAVAWADIQVNNPDNIEPTVYESKLRDRFAVDNPPSVINSAECRGWAREAVAA